VAPRGAGPVGGDSRVSTCEGLLTSCSRPTCTSPLDSANRAVASRKRASRRRRQRSPGGAPAHWATRQCPHFLDRTSFPRHRASSSPRPASKRRSGRTMAQVFTEADGRSGTRVKDPTPSGAALVAAAPCGGKRTRRYPWRSISTRGRSANPTRNVRLSTPRRSDLLRLFRDGSETRSGRPGCCAPEWRQRSTPEAQPAIVTFLLILHERGVVLKARGVES
jgi:hypothetical protein